QPCHCRLQRVPTKRYPPPSAGRRCWNSSPGAAAWGGIAAIGRTLRADGIGAIAFPAGAEPRNPNSFRKAAQPDYGVQAAEGERIGYRKIDRQVSRLIRHVIEVAGRICLEEIAGRRRHGMAYGECSHDGFKSASRAERVAQDCLARGDEEPLRVVAK